MAIQPPASKYNAELARQFALDAEQTFQAAITSATTTYGRGGFVTSANYSAYDTAIKLAYTNRAAELVNARALMATS